MTGKGRAYPKGYKIIFYDGSSCFLQTGKQTQGTEKLSHQTRPTGEENIETYASEIIDIKSMTNRLTAEQVLDKFYEYIGIRTCFSESFM